MPDCILGRVILKILFPELSFVCKGVKNVVHYVVKTNEAVANDRFKCYEVYDPESIECKLRSNLENSFKFILA